jgi:hypothetical protein
MIVPVEAVIVGFIVVILAAFGRHVWKQIETIGELEDRVLKLEEWRKAMRQRGYIHDEENYDDELGPD